MKLIIATLLFFTGCVTPIKNIDPNSMSAVYLEHFKKCSPAENSLRFSYSHQNQRLSFKSDWVAKDEKNWEIHFLDGIGRLQLGVKNSDMNLKISGRAAEKVPNMEIDSEGKLIIQGYYSGLLAKELPCILAGVLPSDWLYSLVSTEKNKHFESTFQSSDRVIKTKFIDANDTNGSEVCTEINWTVMGLISQKSHWCFQKNKGVTSRITFKDHKLVWKTLRGN